MKKTDVFNGFIFNSGFPNEKFCVPILEKPQKNVSVGDSL